MATLFQKKSSVLRVRENENQNKEWYHLLWGNMNWSSRMHFLHLWEFLWKTHKNIEQQEKEKLSNICAHFSTPLISHWLRSPHWNEIHHCFWLIFLPSMNQPRIYDWWLMGTDSSKQWHDSEVKTSFLFELGSIL